MLQTTEGSHEDDGGLEYTHTLQNRADFIRENIENLNQIYFEEYQPHPYPFIVDTETGGAVIQNLIDTELAGRQVSSLDLGSLNKNERLSKIYNYVIS